MAKFRKRPVVIEANEWWEPGDHPEVHAYNPVAPKVCEHCSTCLTSHGWVATLEGGHIVCPGDWIIKGVSGELYPCKPDIFEKTYEPVEGDGFA